MKAWRILTLLLISVISTFFVSANGIKTETFKKLNREQKETLEYAQKLLTRLDGKVALPLEINALIGDTITKDQYQATPLWNEAYFEDTEDCLSHLVIPMKAVSPRGSVISCLNVKYSNGYNFYRTVETILSTPSQVKVTENAFSGIVVKSNMNGIFMRSFIYDNGELKEQIEGLIGNKGYVDYDRRFRYQNINIQQTIEQMGVGRFRHVSNLKDKYNNPAHWIYGEEFFNRVKRFRY